MDETMMNEVIETTTDEVIEPVAEEVVETTCGSKGMKVGLAVGIGGLIGLFAYRRLKPIIKRKLYERKMRKAEKANECTTEDVSEAVDVDFTESDSTETENEQ